MDLLLSLSNFIPDGWDGCFGFTEPDLQCFNRKKSLKIIGRNLFYPFDVSTLLMFQPLLMFQLLLENWKIQIWNLKMTISNWLPSSASPFLFWFMFKLRVCFLGGAQYQFSSNGMLKWILKVKRFKQVCAVCEQNVSGKHYGNLM